MAIDADRRCSAEQLLFSGHVHEGLALSASVPGALGLHLPATDRQATASFLLASARLRGTRFRPREAECVRPHQLMRIDTCFSVAKAV